MANVVDVAPQRAPQRAPHRVLVVAMRPGDELRALQGVLGLPSTSIAEVSVLFMVRDGLTWNDSAAADTLTNRAGEAQRVLDSLGVTRVSYLGAGSARARGASPHSYHSEPSAAGRDEYLWTTANLLAVIADVSAVFREVLPDTVILAGTTSTNADNASDSAAEQQRLNHVVDVVASKLEPEGLGRQATYKDGTSATGHTGLLLLHVIDTAGSVRRRTRQLATLAPSLMSVKLARGAVMPARNVAMRVVTDVEDGAQMVKAYEQYRSRFRVERHDGIPVVRDVSGAFLPSRTVNFVERRGRAIPLAAPASDLDAWRVFPESYSYRRSGFANVSAIIGSVIGGAFVGSVASIWQQYLIGVVPVGLIAGAAALIALLIGIRLSAAQASTVLGWAGGMIAAISVVAFSGQWGDVLLPANALSLIWAYGLPIALALIAVWPHRRA